MRSRCGMVTKRQRLSSSSRQCSANRHSRFKNPPRSHSLGAGHAAFRKVFRMKHPSRFPVRRIYSDGLCPGCTVRAPMLQMRGTRRHAGRCGKMRPGETRAIGATRGPQEADAATSGHELCAEAHAGAASRSIMCRTGSQDVCPSFSARNRAVDHKNHRCEAFRVLREGIVHSGRGMVPRRPGVSPESSPSVSRTCRPKASRRCFLRLEAASARSLGFSLGIGSGTVPILREARPVRRLRLAKRGTMGGTLHAAPRGGGAGRGA